MNSLKKAPCLFFLILLLIPELGFTQDSASKDSLRLKLMHVAKEIMTSAETCALITLDQDGLPRVRAMDPFTPESDFTVWFGTNSDSRKVSQIKNDPRVTLYYLNPSSTGYVMLHGKAQLIDDPKEKDAHWKSEWDAFYPNKDENYLLIKVSPKWIEVISESHGVFGDPVTWEPPIIRFD